MIKILYVTCNTGIWGDNKSLLNITSGLLPKSIKPLVVTSAEGRLTEKLKENSIEYKIIKGHFTVYPKLRNFRDFILFFPRLFRTLIFNWIAEKKLVKLVLTFQPDIIHTNIGPYSLGYRVAKKLNIIHVWHIREFQNLDFNMHPLYTRKSFIKKLNSPQNFSVAISKVLHQHFSLSNNSIVLSHGLSSSIIHFNPQKENYFLFLGRISEEKGISILIDAFIQFCKRNNSHNLLIAGDGNEKYLQMLKNKVSKENLNHRIQFLGFRTDINQLLEKATALIVPSFMEAFGLITIEALFNGCLVIGNNTGGTKEILEEDNLGFLYSGLDQLCNILAEVTTNKIENYFPFILRAQQIAKEKYSLENYLNALYHLYLELLNKKYSTL